MKMWLLLKLIARRILVSFFDKQKETHFSKLEYLNDRHLELCKEVDVDGYPTIYKWQGGKVTGAFSGPFEAAYFETWIDG